MDIEQIDRIEERMLGCGEFLLTLMALTYGEDEIRELCAHARRGLVAEGLIYATMAYRKIVQSLFDLRNDGPPLHARDVAKDTAALLAFSNLNNATKLVDATLGDLHAAPPSIAGEAPHPATADLVRRFSAALAEKLAAAEKKYGYSDGWMRGDWMDECRKHLREHIEKGDPRDVAAYCAFLWHHGESTAAPPSSAGEAEQQAGAVEPRNLFWPGCRVRHRKGGEYVVLFRADYEPTMTDCYVYRGEDGHTWVRPAAQMEDGRFEYADEPAIQPRDEVTSAVTDSLWVEFVVSGASNIPAIRFWTGDRRRARDEISEGRPLREFVAVSAGSLLRPAVHVDVTGKRPLPDLFVTRNGVPVADQAQGVRDFLQACTPKQDLQAAETTLAEERRGMASAARETQTAGVTEAMVEVACCAYLGLREGDRVNPLDVARKSMRAALEAAIGKRCSFTDEMLNAMAAALQDRWADSCPDDTLESDLRAALEAAARVRASQ